MNVARMRLIDRWLGVPVCALLTAWRKLRRRKPPEAETGKILFVKLAEMGSTVLAYPTLRNAVDRYGRENVYFLAFAENRAIVDLLDVIPPENVLTIDAKNLRKAIVGAVAILRKMRSLKIDTAVDLEFFARSSAALAYLSGASRRVGYHGFQGEAAYRGDLMTHRLSFNPYLHTSQTFAIMLEALRFPAEQFPTFAMEPLKLPGELPPFQPALAETRKVKELLAAEFGSFRPSKIVLLNANASDLMPLRRWPSERYVELARRLLAGDPTVGVAFTGAPAEAEKVAGLVAQIGSARCVSMAGKTTLRQLMVLYTLADVLVTNDSGPAHFAALTPVEVVVLFGPETPKLFAALSPRTHPLWAGLVCSPCINAFNDRNSSCRDNQCMKSISVDQVLAELRGLLGKPLCRQAA